MSPGVDRAGSGQTHYVDDEDEADATREAKEFAARALAEELREDQEAEAQQIEDAARALAEELREDPKNVAHRLLLERAALLREGIDQKAKRLHAIEGLLKDCIDSAGPIVDEDLGLRVTYEHRAQRVWDAYRLAMVLTPEEMSEVTETHIVTERVDKLVGRRYSQREIRGCYTPKPVRGPLVERQLPRGHRGA